MQQKLPMRSSERTRGCFWGREQEEAVTPGGKQSAGAYCCSTIEARLTEELSNQHGGGPL